MDAICLHRGANFLSGSSSKDLKAHKEHLLKPIERNFNVNGIRASPKDRKPKQKPVFSALSQALLGSARE